MNQPTKPDSVEDVITAFDFPQTYFYNGTGFDPKDTLRRFAGEILSLENRAARQPVAGSVAPAAPVVAEGWQAAVNICDEYITLFAGHNRHELASAVDQVRSRILAAHPVAGSPAEASREERIGRHVLDFATRGGWKDDGEGAFEFIQRHSYIVGFEDAGGKVDKFGTQTNGCRWPITAFAPAAAEPMPASEAPYGYAMMRDGVMQGHAGNKAIADSWVNAIAVPLTAAPVPASEAASVPKFKDHDIRQLVNDLRDIAIEFHAAQQLRARISDAVGQFLAAPAAPTDAKPDEPNMLWWADDNEVFANGPDEFAEDYATNCLRPGEEAEVRVDCAYRGSQRTMRIAMVEKGDDAEVVWKWADSPHRCAERARCSPAHSARKG